MQRRIILLRGINLGPNKRVPMAELRELFKGAGFDDVRTYVQSGNVVVSSDATPAELERLIERLLEERFGFEVPVVARTRDELAQVVERNPLGDVAENPKRYQVSFLAGELDDGTVARLTELASPTEQFVADGRELYAWHPDGVARSKLWAQLADTKLGVKATARNWTTVETLLEMADE
ncbi:MAG TPA: DUF1697 domain-containing protein [Solirubrobacteraceae bacterium]|jgi:uncharacterized protein (DUF1697 family)